ncbi:MAG: hypothetical protein WC216_02760 [Gallionella sp.]|jgi:hypothetical protein
MTAVTTSHATRPSLDHNGEISVKLEMSGRGYRLVLDYPNIPSSRLTTQLMQGLSLKIGGHSYKPSGSAIQSHNDNHIECEFPDIGTVNPNDATVEVHHEPICVMHKAADGSDFEMDPKLEYQRLTTTEIRMMANADRTLPNVPYSRERMKGFDPAKHAPITDQHTHISAQIEAKDLVDIAVEHDKKMDSPGITYPVELLDMLGIKLDGEQRQKLVTVPSIKFTLGLQEKVHPQCEKDGTKPGPDGKKPTCQAIRMKELTEEQRTALAKRMKIPQTQVLPNSRFDLEIYRYLNPLVKRRELAHDMILKIGEDYHRKHIQYARMFIGPLIDDPEWVREMERATAEVEQKLHVKLRYLNSTRRNNEPENMLRDLNAVKYVSRHPYVSGLDVMGYEFNATEDFSWALEHIAMWADGSDRTGIPGEEEWDFKRHAQLHIHADETGKQTANAIEAARIAYKHGIAVDVSHVLRSKPFTFQEEEILKHLAKRGLLNVILCPPSNAAFNNLFHMGELPIARWEKYAPVFLGSDGGNIVQTDPIQLAVDAMGAGWTVKNLQKMRTNEEKRIGKLEKDEHAKRDVYERQYGKEGPAIDSFVPLYAEHLAKVASHDANAELNGRFSFLIMGAGGDTFNDLIPPHTHREVRQEISLMAEMLRAACRQESNGFILGRTKREGVSREFDEAFRYHRQLHPDRAYPVVGMTALNTTNLPVSITHCERIEGSQATFVQKMCERCMKLNPPPMPIFIGGGDSTRQALRFYHGDHGVIVPYILMSNAPGATQEFAPSAAASRCFTEAIGMIRAIDAGWRSKDGQAVWGNTPPLRSDLYVQDPNGGLPLLDEKKLLGLCKKAEDRLYERQIKTEQDRLTRLMGERALEIQQGKRSVHGGEIGG